MTSNEVKKLITKILEKVYKDASITWDEDKIDVLFINYGWHYVKDLGDSYPEIFEDDLPELDICEWIEDELMYNIESTFAEKMLRKRDDQS